LACRTHELVASRVEEAGSPYREYKHWVVGEFEGYSSIGYKKSTREFCRCEADDTDSRFGAAHSNSVILTRNEFLVFSEVQLSILARRMG
jgi:hypothetical protein